MIGLHRITVLVPAFNEARLLPKTLLGIPTFVDRVLVIDDASEDQTFEVASAALDLRVEVVRHPRNQGVGAALRTGYRHFLAHEPAGVPALCAVMAGDGQMDPSELRTLLTPLLHGEADYAKGNRLHHPDVARIMPRARRFGTRFLSALTRLATGYAHIGDVQCGYTAATREVLTQISIPDLYPRYGYPNDLLLRLAAAGARVVDVPVRPIYASETSNLNPWAVGPRILLMLWRGRRRAERGARLRRRELNSRPSRAQV